jgi:predicted short-subunit dehydrogenase-like oxidoreductase (DUF2520 family)
MVSGSPESARSARDFIGTGELKRDISELPSADLWMVATGDSRFASVCAELLKSDRIEDGNIVFHCSGAVSSSVFDPLKGKGALVGSVHPIRSFADPAMAHRSFTGTYCALEGDPSALERLGSLFEGLGARIFELSKESKTRCHAGHVIVSNYLVALLDIGRRVYETAGVPSHVIDDVMLSLAHSAIANITSLGTTNALTGPIVRGEFDTVKAQLDALRPESEEGEADVSAAVYASLGQAALQIAERKGTLSSEEITRLRTLLKER